MPEKTCLGEKCPIYFQGDGCSYNQSNFSPEKKENAPFEPVFQGQKCLHPEILNSEGTRISDGALEIAATKWLSG